MYDQQGRVTNQPEGKFPLGFVRQVLLCVFFFKKKLTIGVTACAIPVGNLHHVCW